ncbi:MAG: DNA polymerase III subunit beta, partial [Coriobacteriales bacterium]
KTTMPILNGLLLETRNDQLFCLGSDLEIGIEVQIPEVTIITPGRVVVAGRTLYDIIRHLPAGRVEMGLDPESNTFKINTAHSKFELNTYPAEEYPVLPEGIMTIRQVREDKTKGSEYPLFSLSAAAFSTAVKQSIYATAPNDSRPFLSSVLWEINQAKLRLVATDINRLVIKDLPVNGDFVEEFLVPVKSLKEMAVIFGDDPEEEINFLLLNRQLYATGRGVVFYTRLINAQFPRYEQVIPEEFDGQIQCDRTSILTALTRSSLVDSAVKLSLSPDCLNIYAMSPDLGQFSEDLNCSYQDQPLEIGFNVYYLMDFLKVIEPEQQVVLNLSQGMKASVLKVEGSEDYTYVIMPLRLNY